MADSTFRPPGEEFSWYDEVDKDKKTYLSATQAKLQHGVSRADLDAAGAVGLQVENPFYNAMMTVFSMPDIWRAETAREEREGKEDQDSAKRRVEERPARQASESVSKWCGVVCVAWYGVVWCGFVLCGVVLWEFVLGWCGVVWCGVEWGGVSRRVVVFECGVVSWCLSMVSCRGV
jgi:hypothetical protein